MRKKIKSTLVYKTDVSSFIFRILNLFLMIHRDI